MSQVNFSSSQAIPLLDVCLSSAPFEIWFPTLGPHGLVELCMSTTAAEFRINPFISTANAHGCLTSNGDGVTNAYIGGFLYESTPKSPAGFYIFGTRAQPASNGYEKYFVSTLHYITFADQQFADHSVSLSKQRANLYLFIFSTKDYRKSASDANIEHFVLRFK